MDYGGLPCDYDALIALGERHGIPIVADCAHAHGTRWKGTGVGALTELGTFSFQAFKQLTTGEGGMVLTNREDLAQRAYAYHHIGRLKGRPFYEHHVPASNLRMTEWQGAIGLAQLARLEAQTETREANSRRLAAGLEALQESGVGVAPCAATPASPAGASTCGTRFLPEPWEGVTRNDFLRALRAEGLPGGTGHTQPLYKNPFLDPEQALGAPGSPPGWALPGADGLPGGGLPADRAHLRHRGGAPGAPPLPGPPGGHGRHPGGHREGVAPPGRAAREPAPGRVARMGQSSSRRGWAWAPQLP